MDFSKIYEQLCRNYDRLQNDENYTMEQYKTYCIGTIDAVKNLGLWEEYNKWADENGIPGDESDEEEEG